MSSIKFDNIFDVITDSPEEAFDLKTRGDLIISLRDIINENISKRKLTTKELDKAEAGKLIRDTQSSNL
jgi:predicted XRE-type DNA-binding protein